MSREIKFRGWIDKPGRWEDDDCANKMYYNIQNSYDMLGDVEPEDIMQSFDEWFITDNCIVEQYTGLTDKNGKEIYEGDIIREKWYDNDVNRGTDRIGKIEYFCDRFVCWFGGTFVNLGMFTSENIEVIGNIHENPELIEN